jgi:hypothetical protein
MNCRDLERLLAEGAPLSPQALSHVRECSGCGLLLDVLAQPTDPVSPVLVNTITAGFTGQLIPVRPLPSDRALMWIGFGFFVVFTLLLTSAVGFAGFRTLTPAERIVYYSLIAAFGLLFSASAAPALIPAAKVRVRASAVAFASVLALTVAVSLMFPGFTLDRFVSRGIPCLRFGCICAALYSLFATLLLRRGFVTELKRTALYIACIGGFSGVAVLSLHCPLRNAPHIIVWHLGCIAVSALAGALIGHFLTRRA